MISETEIKQDDYSNLTPDVVISAIESLGYLSDLRILALNSYENRVYQVGIEDDKPVIAKFYRPGRWTNEQILEEHQFIQQLNENEIPVVPLISKNEQTLFNYEGYRFSLFPRFGGRAPELSNPENLFQLGRYIGRIHAMSSANQFHTRPQINTESFLLKPYDYIIKHNLIPADLEMAYRSLMDDLIEKILPIYQSCQFDIIPLHGDCHVGNILWNDEDTRVNQYNVKGPTFLDFDDSRSGPAIQDIWMLLSGSDVEQRIQLSELIEGYEEFHQFNKAELVLIEPLRTMRIVHYVAWLAQRWSDPAFPMAFPWFGEQRFWEQHILELREQFSALQHDPLAISDMLH